MDGLRGVALFFGGGLEEADSRAHLNERVDGHDGHIGLRLGVVHQVQIDQLLQLEVVRLHAVDDVREERGNVLANRHAGDDLEIGNEKKIITHSGERRKSHSVACQLTFLTASFFFSFLSLLSSDLSSKISPFLVVVKYLESVIPGESNTRSLERRLDNLIKTLHLEHAILIANRQVLDGCDRNHGHLRLRPPWAVTRTKKRIDQSTVAKKKSFVLLC